MLGSPWTWGRINLCGVRLDPTGVSPRDRSGPEARSVGLKETARVRVFTFKLGLHLCDQTNLLGNQLNQLTLLPTRMLLSLTLGTGRIGGKTPSFFCVLFLTDRI